MLKIQLPRGGLRKGLDGLLQAHGRKTHVVGIALAQAQASGLPKRADALGSETKQARTHDIGRRGIGAGNDQTGLNRISSQRPLPIIAGWPVMMAS